MKRVKTADLTGAALDGEPRSFNPTSAAAGLAKTNHYRSKTK